jgi:hypothetical protein
VPIRRRRWLVVAVVAALLVATVAAVAIRLPISSDALRDRVVAALAERLDGDVELQGFTVRLFPRLRASGTGLRVWHLSRRDLPPLIGVSRFTVEADLVGLWRRRIARVTLEGLAISIPPREARRERVPEPPESPSPAGSSYARDLVISELHADDGRLVILRAEAAKPPRTWQLHRVRLREVGVASRMPFDATITNAVPPGEIATSGAFGPWAASTPGLTPLDGRFTFEKADLGVFTGISGMLSAHGTFGGTLDQITVEGQTDTPDFTIDVSGHPVHLRTTYRAVVDATNGNTTLDPVNATVIDTSIVARGGVYEVEGVKGREVRLDVTIDQGRLEDIMRLAVRTEEPPMAGGLTLSTSMTIPPGRVDVVDKLLLDGRFAIEQGRFTNREVQRQVAELSRRGSGRKPGTVNPARVRSNFAGRFRLADAELSLNGLTFDVPGAVVEMSGAYSLRRETLAFAGGLYLDARLSQTVSGFKSLLLKPIDPLFRRNGRTRLPLKISGTRNAPRFGLDVRRVFRR